MSDNDNMPNSNQATSDEPLSDPAQTERPAANEEWLETQRQRDEYRDQLQRTRAEFANYQKRAKAQADADRAYAAAPLAADLIAVLDNFERAAEAARAAGAASIVEGLDMVGKQLMSTLAKHGIQPIEALGQPFDPNMHEALIQQPDADHPEGTVVAELGKGYRLLDRVLRPAKVAVSVRP
ncbi:MAG TPA: nucleotide exchange factor GrpE [Isosphaeraceae bacterium]|jgi:molecular chaperone GrpE|nr:nucleotide exchange factor GrpE [Isosphaeraceae bacterium]